MSLLQKSKNWLTREQFRAIDLGWLLIAVATTDFLIPLPSLEWGARLAIFVIALLLPTRQPAQGTSLLARWRARLPWQLAVCAVTVMVLVWWLALPLRALLFLPLWLAASFATYLLRAKAQWVTFVWDWWRQTFVDHRWDILITEASIVGSFSYAAACFWPHFWPKSWVAIAIAVAWPLGRAIGGWHQPAPDYRRDLARLAIVGLPAMLAAVILTSWRGDSIPDVAHLVVPAWCALALVVHRGFLRALQRRGAETIAENARLTLLLVAALWLMRGFARSTVHGTGDALWYGTMLADMVAQTRAGVFPVWLGQSIYQFNGAIYPLRVAPAFHYLGALLDALTLHTLGVFALQNLLITLIGVSTILITYFCLSALLLGRCWFAASLALLFLACPGVLGIAYNTDLFMSWTTLPVMPLAWFASMRSFRDRGALGSLLLLGGALGLCWWGHSPIALWTTLFAGTIQLVRVILQRPRGRDWLGLAGGAAVFAAIAFYPLGSVLLFPPEPGINAAGFQIAKPDVIVYFLRQAFPAVLLPLSNNGRSLGDFQLGYALWGILLAGLWRWRCTPRIEARIFLAIAALLVVLLTPFPGMNLALWSAIPGFIRNITGNWVMNRLYLLLAGTIVFGAAATATEPLGRPARRLVLAVLVTLGCVWSLVEAARFAQGSRRDTRPAESAVDLLRLENVLITRFAYLVFPRLPDNFSHGVIDPGMEHRLLARGTFAPITSNSLAALASARELRTDDLIQPAQKGATWLELPAPLVLEPGRRYLLEWRFQNPAQTIGVLQLAGCNFFREYALPEYGAARAFGAGGQHVTWLSLWTTTSVSESVTVRFFPTPGAENAGKLLPLAQARLLEFDPAALPVKVESWIDYQALVHSPTAAWLETPRMFQIGYVASVNGAPAAVQKSPQGLACIAVPAGNSHVDLRYRPPWGLAALFWLSLSTAAGLALMAIGMICRHMRQIRSCPSP